MNLELKIPPVLVVIITAVIMLALAQIPMLKLISSWVAAVLFMLIGGMVIVMAVTQFTKAKTTVNPMNPNDSSQIVATGIFAISRNPMYVGMALILLGLAMGLGSLLVWLMIIGFVLYMTYFQIKPEERILAEKFGDDYRQYCAQVRRWV